MKKVKIMLTAITIIAAVGGALAYKAAKFGSTIYCTNEAYVGACTIETRGFSVDPIYSTQQGLWAICTTTNDPIADCTISLIYVNE